MNEPISPYVLTNQNSPAFWLIDNLWMPLAGSFLTDGNFCFIEQICGVGIGGPSTHAHPSDEGLYILEGQCTFNAGGKTFKAGPGTFVSVPRLVEHSFTVDVPNSRLLNWYPGGFEMLLMGIATPAAERKPPVPNSLPMPPRWMVEDCAREFGQITVHGLPFADPPTKDNMATRPSEVNPVKPYGVEAKNAPAYWSQGILWTILATADQTGGSYSLMEELCSLNSGPPPHTHEQDEVLYIIEGEVTLIAGSLKITAKGGFPCLYSCALRPQLSRRRRQDSPFELLPSGRLREGDYGIRSSRQIAHASTRRPQGIRNTGADESSLSKDWHESGRLAGCFA